MVQSAWRKFDVRTFKNTIVSIAAQLCGVTKGAPQRYYEAPD